ncbi:hypothetical protein Tco_0991153 [Tanacetum coccineum]|uniref:Uncharacterized protein n=1 Tax=Tanacetum coccineum TaxID=301880 RepID=A0ABQ5EYU4_9ASTR
MAQVHLLQSQKLKLEKQKEKAKAEVTFLKARPLYLDINQLTKLLVTSLKPKLSKLLASHDFSSHLPTKLKELPLKITELSRQVKELKKHVTELNTIQWKLPVEFLGLPSQIISVQEKLKILDALLSLLNKVTDTLNRFSTIVENASPKATYKGVPSACQANPSPAEEEKNTTQATKDADNANLKQQPTTKTPPTTSSFQSSLFLKSKGKEVMSSKDAEDEETKSDSKDDHANLADSMIECSKQKKLKKFSFVTEGVTQYYNMKLLYDKYCNKMIKRRKISKITNCDVLTKKGSITIKVYREDGTNEVISNFKVSDLHLAEWREVVQACPNKKEKGWKTVYGLRKTRMDYLDQTEKELRIEFNRTLKEQDPLDELNDLDNKKRKRAGDFKDHSRSTKKHKSSVQHEKEVH